MHIYKFWWILYVYCFCRRYSSSQFATINFLTGLRMNFFGFSVTYLVLLPSYLEWLPVSMQWKISIWKLPIQLPQISRYLLTAIWLIYNRLYFDLTFKFLNIELRPRSGVDVSDIFIICAASCTWNHLQGKKWDFSFSSVWNTIVWLMLMNFFVKIVNATAQNHLKKQQEKHISELTEKSTPTDSGVQWIVYVLLVSPLFLAVPSASRKLKFKLKQFLLAPQKLPWKSALEVL